MATNGIDGNGSGSEALPRKRWRKRFFLRLPLIVAVVVLIKGTLAMLLWNALIPDLFHGPVLSFVQAVGLVILAKLLFGCGFGPPHGRHGPPAWVRWHHMTPEERLKLRDELKKSSF